MRTVEGQLSGRGLRVAVVVARFNEAVTERLLAGALDCLRRHGVADDDLTVVRVPGSFEVPLAARTLAAAGEHDALVCLGALVRGETAHFDLLAAEVTGALGRIMEASGLPIAFGILTTDDLDQALQRAGGKAGNKGWEAALTAIEMAGVIRELKASGRPRI